MSVDFQGPSANELPKADFKRLSEEILKRFGIAVSASHRSLFAVRIRRRLHALGMSTFSDYVSFILATSLGDAEFIHLLDSVTTHRPEFFNNPDQLEFLAQFALPELIKTHGAGVSRPLIIWYAGCSTGEEPYTVAIVLKEFALHYPGIKFQAQILATDVSARALEQAENAVYDIEKVKPIPVAMKKKYLLKSRNQRKSQVRMGPELRSMVRFRRIDFLDEAFGLRERMDVIFCRNTLSYFDLPTQERLAFKLLQQMAPGAYLFVGQSESLEELNVPLVTIAPAIYQMPFSR